MRGVKWTMGWDDFQLANFLCQFFIEILQLEIDWVCYQPSLGAEKLSKLVIHDPHLSRSAAKPNHGFLVPNRDLGF